MTGLGRIVTGPGTGRPSAADGGWGRPARRRRPACGSSSTPGRSRPPTARRSPPPTSTGCWRPSTRRRSAGESFAFLLGSDLDDPTERFGRLEVVGRRQLPPTRLLRSGAMTVDPFVLRGAAVGAAWRAERGGAAGAVYHAVGGGPLPIASGLPLVVTLLDLAPWELPERVPALGGEPLRAAPPGADPARRGCGHRRQRGDGPGRPPAAPDPARPAPRRRRSRRGRVPPSRSARPTSRAAPRSAAASLARAARPPAALPRAVRAGSTPGWTSRRCSSALERWPRPGGPAGLAADEALAAADPARRRQPGRPRRDRPRGRAAGDRRALSLRAGARRRGPRRPRPRRARRRPAGRSPRRPGCPSSRRSRPARRSWPRPSGHSPSWSARPGCWSSRAIRPGSPWRWPRSGRTTACTTGSRRWPASGPRRRRRTWADVARETRAIYAEPSASNRAGARRP